MEKLARKIFQPNALTNEIIEGVCSNGGTNISDLLTLPLPLGMGSVNK